jgi:alpha-glucosidase
MYFSKYPHPSNFSFVDAVTMTGEGDSSRRSVATDIKRQSAKFRLASKTVTHEATLTIATFPGDVHHVTVRSPLWPRNWSQAELDFEAVGRSTDDPAGTTDGAATVSRLSLRPDFRLTLTENEVTILDTGPAGFGVCGAESVWRFAREPEDAYYGMGEKWFGRLELSSVRTKFWNTDVWADFAVPEYECGEPDPVYVSIPYLIIRRRGTFIGMLVHNPEAVFVDTGARSSIESFVDAGGDGPLVVGTESGPLDLVVLCAKSLGELTRRFQRLVGTTPLPAAWALGYHQSRWGYGSAADLHWLNESLDSRGIPCDGLWLDIDYMDHYRVFTFDPHAFPDPTDDVAKARSSGRNVVPILDPGIKKEDGFSVYDSGVDTDVFCLNPQGLLFNGLVWPGETVFPDFSTETGRAWWANNVERFASHGIAGVWIDMNDPATGSPIDTDMLFSGGTQEHSTFHNQYAHGMARATRAGLEGANPGERVFVLSRSASTGTGRYAAVWTGDNYSNHHHLAASIPTSINLALSGIPFNGSDVGGFGGDASDQLMIDWVKAGFLFPFFRIHTATGTRSQEPWSLGGEAPAICTEYIQSRYRLRPYLYNLFIEQEERGDAILRPLIYEFADDRRFRETADQFMIGPAILQAPFVEAEVTERAVQLPFGHWYEWESGTWIEGGRSVQCTRGQFTTPLFIREASIVPVSTVEAGSHRWDGTAVEFLVLSPPGRHSATVAAVYRWDDGHSTRYKAGERSAIDIRCERTARSLSIGIEQTLSGYGTFLPTFVFPGPRIPVSITLNGDRVPFITRSGTIHLAGCDHDVTRYTVSTNTGEVTSG